MGYAIVAILVVGFLVITVSVVGSFDRGDKTAIGSDRKMLKRRKTDRKHNLVQTWYGTHPDTRVNQETFGWIWQCSCGAVSIPYSREELTVTSFKEHRKNLLEIEEAGSPLVEELTKARAELAELKNKCICKDL